MRVPTTTMALLVTARLRAAPRLASRVLPPSMAASTAAPAVPTLDERLVAEEPEMVRQSLTMRRAAPEQLAAVERIGALTRERSGLVAEGNRERERRKKLSTKIGGLMKQGEMAEAEKVKAEVATAAATIDATDAKLASVEEERSTLRRRQT